MKSFYAILFFVAFAIPSFSQSPATSTQSIQYVKETSRPESKVEKKFPFDIALKNADGKEFVSNKILKKNGKPTILMFWLTTCGPCRMELEAIKGKYAAWTKEAKFNFFAISTDWLENSTKFEDRVKAEKWPFDAYHDFNREFKYVMPGGLNGLPQVFVLNKEGEIIYHKRKYIPGDEDTLIDEIKKLQ
jgi:cytochrome c biogenesis protein CcmG/thiol:disulfide interchange protein DsbE